MILDEFVRGCPSFRICREMWRGTRAPEDLRLLSDAWVLDGEFGRSREDEQGMSFDKGRRGDRGGRGRDKRDSFGGGDGFGGGFQDRGFGGGGDRRPAARRAGKECVSTWSSRWWTEHHKKNETSIRTPQSTPYKS